MLKCSTFKESERVYGIENVVGLSGGAKVYFRVHNFRDSQKVQLLKGVRAEMVAY